MFNAAMMQRKFGCCTVSALASAADTPTTQDKDRELWYDSANNHAIVYRVCTTLSDGTTSITWENIDGTPNMTNSANFTPEAAAVPDIDVETEIMYATNTDAADAQYGRYVPLKQVDNYVDGVLDPTAVAYFDTSQQPNVDVTAIVTAAPYTIDAAVQRVQLTGENLDITGAVELALAAIPATATYAEIYIDASADDTGIRWTKDGTTPADDNGEQEMKGTTIKLLDRPEIDGFKALAIDGSGAVDATLTASLTVNYWNVAPDED